MSYRVDPQVKREFAEYGGETAHKCFTCGNCTAVCSLTDWDTAFPRQYIRYINLGLVDLMRQSPDPWLCYYCGDCSDTCPRDVEPGEMMMASRRWLTGQYDWTGIGRLMYKSEAMEILFLVLAAVGVALWFLVTPNFGFHLLAQNPEARTAVDLAAFAPKHAVHIFDLIMAVCLAGLLGINSLRMMYWTMKGKNVPLTAYVIEIKEFIIHLFTQKKWGECETNASKHWIRHVFLVTGYLTMLLLVIFFLPWFQVEGTNWHWTALFGYYTTGTLLIITSWMVYDRMLKKDQIHKFSHLSDWMFPILLWLSAFTGILLHIFRLADIAMATYWIYFIHMMIAVPMLIIEVPFGKWAHLVYRPLAIYLKAVQRHAVRVKVGALAAVETN